MSMIKPDFEDYHKFQVSLSLVMIALGPLAAWLALRQSFDFLMVRQSDDGYSEFGVTVLRFRQYVGVILIVVMVVSAQVVSIWGVRRLVTAASRWREIQDVLDRTAVANLRHLESGLIPQSPKQIEENVNSDVSDAEASEQIKGDDVVTSSAAQVNSTVEDELTPASLREAETAIGRRIETVVHSGFAVMSNMAVKGIGVDLVLRSADRKVPDVLVEIKHAKSRISGEMFQRTVFQFSMALQAYIQTTKRLANLVVIYVFQDQNIAISREERVSSALELLQNLGVNATVVFTTLSRLESASDERLFEILSGAVRGIQLVD